MFEISFGELLLIGVVALIVLGPERLPTVARTLGALVGRAQRFVASVKADIHQQADLTGLSSLQQEVQDAAVSLRHSLEAEMKEVEGAVQENVAAVQAAGEEAVAALDSARTPSAPATFVPDDPLEADLFAAACAGDDGVEPTAPNTVVHDENQLDLFDSPPVKPATTPAETRE
ncbi:Sec-independent protein translocase protein TatB [Pseudogulbenkiania sp. MAI-1]|uniref:Sec-independent protein translocase protein TatB n=1 Tax=Pseudogulbenkiania sp. MAI-1 TaxID=990370 RepID=UPI00045E705A|nr:Sec-independent protein translocase protein TatB [Pseudogulbenkiania sp. MAI-1]